MRKFLLVLLILFTFSITIAWAQDEEPVHLTYSTWATGDPLLRVERVLDEFMEAHPNIKVEIQPREIFPGPDEILVQLATGTASDVILIGETYFSTLAEGEEAGFMNLNSFIEGENGIDTDIFYPEVFANSVIDGEVYSLTKDYATVAIYINTDLFDEAGIPYPEEGWTYDDLVEIAQQLTLDENGNDALSPDFDPDNIVQYGISSSSGWVRGWISLAYAFGAEKLMNDEGTQVSDYLNTEAVAEAMEYWRDLVHKYHVAPSTADLEAQPGIDLFASGQAAMLGPYGPWNLTGYAENPDLNFATVPMPTGPAGHYSVICWASIGINRTTEHPEEAWELLKWMGTAPGQSVFVEVALSSMPEILNQSGKLDDPLWRTYIDEIPYLHPIEDIKNHRWNQCLDVPLNDLLMVLRSPEGADVDPRPVLEGIAETADVCLTEE